MKHNIHWIQNIFLTIISVVAMGFIFRSFTGPIPLPVFIVGGILAYAFGCWIDYKHFVTRADRDNARQ